MEYPSLMQVRDTRPSPVRVLELHTKQKGVESPDSPSYHTGICPSPNTFQQTPTTAEKATLPYCGSTDFRMIPSPPGAEENNEAAARLLMLLKVPRQAHPTKSLISKVNPIFQFGGSSGTPPGRAGNKFRSIPAIDSSPDLRSGSVPRRNSGSFAPSARKQPRAPKPAAVRAAARELMASIARTNTPSPTLQQQRNGGGGTVPSRTPKRSPKSRAVDKSDDSPVKRARKTSSAGTVSPPAELSAPAAAAAAGGAGPAQPSAAPSAAAAAAAALAAAGIAAGGSATGAKTSDHASFFIKGSQGQLDVCEYRTVEVDGVTRPYLLVRLRGQSNTLPNDSSLSVIVPTATTHKYLDVCFSRVRLKAGGLKYDYLPTSTRIGAAVGEAGVKNGCSFGAQLDSSIFSKKCWQGMVVRGPRMFIAYIRDAGGAGLYHSVPMFVEISPTSNNPEYRDPVLEYPTEIVQLFFDMNAVVSNISKAPAPAAK